mgnify:CR=1 FL=1
MSEGDTNEQRKRIELDSKFLFLVIKKGDKPLGKGEEKKVTDIWKRVKAIFGEEKE